MNKFEQFVTEIHKKMQMITLDLSVMENVVRHNCNRDSSRDIAGAMNIRRIHA